MIVDVACAARLLRDGAVVAYPTETVYGLGADAVSETALERLRALKGRSRDMGLSLLLEDAEALATWAPDAPKRVRRIAERFWPGPLTLVCPGADSRLGGVATERGVGFRCSPQPTARALVEALGRPIVSTSCNRSGETPCANAEEVGAHFGEALAVAGGEPAGGAPPSTVLAIGASGDLEILRTGELTLDRILEAA